MVPFAPILAIQTRDDREVGLVSVDLLVQGAAEAGYQSVALVDAGTIRAAPRFVESCRRHRIAPLIGFTCRLTPREDSTPTLPEDVFDWNPEGPTACPPPHREPVRLIAVHPRGYAQVVGLVQNLRDGSGCALTVEELLEASEGLFLWVGGPGSRLQGESGGRAVPAPAELRELVSRWPKDRVAYAGLRMEPGAPDLPRQMDRVAAMGIPIKPVGVAWGSYRTAAERFWGAVRAYSTGCLASGAVPGIVPSAFGFQGCFHGYPGPIRTAEALTQRAVKATPSFRLAYPIYPSPRGTDVASFFWSLGQESAIATGHIRVPGVKERLMEEFQFLKQTPWPGVWLALWDVRRHLGLPPGTFRHSAEWTATSLFAHLLGLVRVDPFRERIKFSPRAPFTPPEESLCVDVEGPAGMGAAVFESFRGLFGERQTARLLKPDSLNEEELKGTAVEVQRRWSEFELEGDAPPIIPPFPISATHFNGGTGEEGDIEVEILVSGGPLGLLFPSDSDGLLDVSPGDVGPLGAWRFRITSTAAQTVAAAPAYRPGRSTRSGGKKGRETLSDWVESHRGRPFSERGYADDVARLDVLAASSAILRLLTLPGSAGYRPLLWYWLFTTRPTRIGQLADLLALQWHWTYWNQRPEKRRLAARRRDPLVSEESEPPWWEDWKGFLAAGRLPAQLSGKLGAALEEASRNTGGWILYRDQVVAAIQSAFGTDGIEAETWLGEGGRTIESDSEEGPGIWDPSLRSQFLRFLGHPLPLPARLDFLRRAEWLGTACDAFVADPAGVTALLSYLQEDTAEERREVYSLLRTQGVGLSPPRLGPHCRYDRSPTPSSLEVGAYNLVGIGPHLAGALEAALQSPAPPFTPDQLFRPPMELDAAGFTGWLHRFEQAGMNRKLVRELIDLDFFRSFGSSRGTLIAEARAARRDPEGTSAVQSTLFPLGSPRHPGPEVESREAGAMDTGQEIDLFRFGVKSTPLDLWKGKLPPGWLAGDHPGRPRELLVGWVHEVDVFGGGRMGLEREDLEARWASYVLFTPNSAVRIVDEEGRILEHLPVQEAVSPRNDGQRVVLRRPLGVLMEVGAAAFPDAWDVRSRRALDVETLESVVERSGSISEIALTVDAGVLKNEASLIGLFDWCDGGPEAAPVRLVDESPILRRSGMKRFIQRFGARTLPASELLLRRFLNQPGVRKVAAVGAVKPLFEPERE